jgi:hypothetical protein
MYLAARRHVDHQVPLNEGVARQPVSLGQRLTTRKLLLGSRERIHVGGTGGNTVLWEITFHYEDLAPPAQSPSSTNGININAEGARRLEEGRPDRKSSAFA